MIYAMMGPAQALVDRFTASTGIRVTYVNLDGGVLEARLYAEGDHPRWTLAWMTGDAPMAALDAENLLARHAGNDPDWPDARFTALARSIVPSDRAWLPTRIGLGAAFVSYDAVKHGWPDVFARDTIIGLLSPERSGGAFPVIATILAVADGGGRKRLSGAAHGVRSFAASPFLYQALRSGEIGLAIVPSEAAYRFHARDPALVVSLPAPDTVLPDVIGLSRHADADAGARADAGRFIRFVLSPEGQALLGRDTASALGWPAVRDVPADPGIPALPPGLVRLPPAVWGARQNNEIAWFEAETAR